MSAPRSKSAAKPAATSRGQPRAVAEPPPAPAEAGTLAEQAYAQIKQMIFDFALMPGDRFSEPDLAKQVQVSRTPLRQALQRLAREGFLLVFPKLGWQVAPLDFDVIDELYDLRVLIECHAAQRLASVENRETLQPLVDFWMVDADQRLADAAAVGAMDERFHGQLVESSGNREMARVHQELTDRIRIVRRLDFTKAARVTVTYDEHTRILRAILRRRSDEAQRLLRAHIEQSKLEARHITLDVLYRARRKV